MRFAHVRRDPYGVLHLTMWPQIGFCLSPRWIWPMCGYNPDSELWYFDIGPFGFYWHKRKIVRTMARVLTGHNRVGADQPRPVVAP